MKNHVWRPLFVVIGLVLAILTFRFFYVPNDFASGAYGFMYSFHRLSNQDEWKAKEPKYRDTGAHHLQEFCMECHGDIVSIRTEDMHGTISCENCHGPALQHPEAPEKLLIDRSRDVCLRCHTNLIYPTSDRKRIPGIEPEEHNPGLACVDCHNPHNPRLEDM
ncbi:cytochrome c3 family protein [Geoalkalibacter sp.]|uniref:cytochrome c3 family protein n=1 Tax=Geoalkalibacter sp. TaxID=3041440 RepID=UPI00272E336A|nr:cytochrome c3 family protein [Geoalkalibacter sp.]